MRQVILRVFLTASVFVLVTGEAFSSEDASSGRWTLWSKAPASKWEDAFVTGNGRHGTMVMGAAGNERIICVHEELFLRPYDRDFDLVADLAYLLPEVRRLMNENKADIALQMSIDIAIAQVKKKYGKSFTQNRKITHPAFDLNIVADSSGQVQDYHRSLNLATGEALSRWSDDRGGIEQSVFSSREHNVNVVMLRATGKQKLNLLLSLSETHEEKTQELEKSRGNYKGFDLPNVSKTQSVETEFGWLDYYADYIHDRGGYESVARVTTVGGQMEKQGDQLRIKDADSVLVIIKINPLRDASSPEREVVKNELAKLPRDYDALLKPHVRKHSEMFKRVVLDLGRTKEWQTTSIEEQLAKIEKEGVNPLLLEQLHAMGRYLLISSCGKYPPPLQGIWGGSSKPKWSGGWCMDINAFLAISSAAMGNLPECAESYFGFIERILPGWRLNARSYLGCRGFLCPVHVDPENGCMSLRSSLTAPYAYVVGYAGWSIRPFYDYALLTGDKQFMEKRLLPIYKESAEFYQDYCVEENDGKRHIFPGNSPENFPKKLPRSRMTKDSTFDVAVAKETFDVLIDVGQQLGLEKKQIEEWKAFRQSLPDYRINEDGALAEWIPEEYGDNYNHRHNSHLYPVFPSLEFLQPGTDQKLIDATRIAIDKRFLTYQTSAFGMMHIALAASRLHDIESVRTILDRFARTRYLYNSFMTSHNSRSHSSVYNLDSILSFPRLFMEMLVFSRPGLIDLMPGWPEEYADGSIRGVLVRGGHKIDISWKDGMLDSAVLYAGQNDTCEIRYGDKHKTLKMKKGESYRFNGDLEL